MPADDYNPLLARCALRDEHALQELYAQTSPRLYALVLGIVRNHEWAEEVMQDAFVKIWINADRFQPDKSGALTWMSTIVRNRALDKLREIKRNPLLQQNNIDDIVELPMISEGLSPGDIVDQDQDLQSIVACLSTLEANQRQAIIMSYYHGYSHQELSNKLDKPLGTVKGWVRRGLEKLRGCLANRAE